MSLHADHSAAASGDSSIESALFDETTDSLLKESRPLCEEQSLPPGVFDWRNSDCTLDNEGIVSQLSSTEESLPPSTDDFRDCEGASTSGSIVSNTDGFLSPDADHSSICDSIPNSEDSVTPSKEFLSPARVDLDNCECTQNSEQVCPDPEERPSAGTADFSNCESTLSNESPPVTPSENFRKTLAFDPAGSDKHLESEKEVSPGSSPSKSTARLSPGQITSTSSSPVPPAPARLSLFTPRSVRMKLEVPIAKKGDTKALYEQPTRTTIRTEVVGFSKETEYDCLLRNAGPGELLNFYVVEVEKRSPACYVWISKKPLAKCPKEISRMNYALKRFYSCIPWSASTTARIFIGQAVAVRLKRDEWVRGRVLSVENTVVELSLVDMGGTYSANLREIRILDEQFFTPKGLVWRAEIAGLDPFRYDTETANHLSRMLKERNYLGTIVTLKPVPTIRLFDDTCYRRPVEISAVLFQTLHLPETEEIRLGVVIHICSNSSVNHLLLVDVRHLTELEKIQRAVESAGKAKIPLDKDSSDSVVAVERNGVMCRGMILNRIKEDRALVELFDFGHRFVTRLNNLYRLPGNVRDLPSVTLWCVVSGVSDISNHSRLRCILKGLVQKTVLFEPLYYLAPQQAVVKLWDDKMQPLADQLPADDNILMDLRVEDVDWPLEYHEHQMLHAEVTNTFDNAHDGRTILGAFLGSYNSFGVEPEEAEESEEREESSAEVDCSDAVDSDEFMSEIQCECKLPSSRLKSTLLTNYIECPEKNTLVCALSKEMNKWCRAIIYEKKGAMDDPTVYLIDLGQWEVLPLENLRPMRPEWMKMPWRSSMLHVNEFVMASLSEGKWLISKTFPLEQIQKSKEYRFVITKTEAPFFHGILIMEDVIDLNDSGKQ
ncbi:uncharacterized protein LOC129585779 isoform X2 [Paramacrobiotus metropolitanus]|uniref:uncharacterized protein LOC129585779 isoform X2 n=1 Tax=Paramacrobiotus metropolitanus TaxID=2943436 RepID=UPI002445F6D3|nr:uncharacterized protein LOC129585779 isoform X2 [Paramacrobiotus metropolitanus]